MELLIPTTCPLSKWDDNLIFNTNFTNGALDYSPFSYDNVGDINVTITDDVWTQTDQDSFNGKGYNDCIPDSNTTTPDIYGKIGCNISMAKTFFFVPKKFENRVRFNHLAGDDFAYLGANENFSPQILLTTQALLDNDKGVATNYTADCYAKDIDYTIAFERDEPIGWTHPDSTIATDVIYFFDDGGITTNIDNDFGHRINASTSEGNFTNGIASDLTFAFNFEKPWPAPQEPFKVTRNDFNITSLLDENNVSGEDFNRTADHNATFYYGRIHAPDYRGASPVTAKVGYEVYCKHCNRADFNISNDQSPSSPNWFFNTRHDNLNHGAVNGFVSSDGTTLNKAESDVINSGSENLILTAPAVPHIDRITMTPNTWLIFNPFDANATTTDFVVEFVGSGRWTGEGAVSKDKNNTIGGHLKEESNSERTNRRISW